MDKEKELKAGEPHPMAQSALDYIARLSLKQRATMKESLASTALAGNKTSEICLETLRRLEEKEPVSDRYVLGLAWLIREMEDSL